MKKQSFLLMAGALMALASCQNDNSNTADQAQIDSMVNARVEEMRIQMMAANDSLINIEAQRRADSIIAAMKGGNTVTTHTTRTTTVKNTPGGTKTTTDTKSNLPSGVNDRPGGNNDNRLPRNTNDRPGGNDASKAPKSVNDRPGGNK